MNFGIVGTGLIAEFHAKALAEIPEAKLVACIDVVPERAASFAARFGCAAYSDMASFLRHPKLDIVNVCTPSGLHLDAALPAAAAGKHLIVEKPLEVSSERCGRMIEACDKAGVTLSGIFPSRFHDSSRTIKSALGECRFGRLTMGNAYVKWWREQSYYDKGGWKGKKALDGGGALMNQSIHAIDLLRWFMGPIEEVNAFTGAAGHSGIDVEDNAIAAVRFANGALGAIQGSTSVWPGFLKRLEVSGMDGSIVMEEENIPFWKFRVETGRDDEIRANFAGATSTGGGASDPAAIGYHGHKLQFLDVIGAIGKGEKPSIDGREAAKAVAIIEAIYKSAETGKSVKVVEQ